MWFIHVSTDPGTRWKKTLVGAPLAVSTVSELTYLIHYIYVVDIAMVKPVGKSTENYIYYGCLFSM